MLKYELFKSVIERTKKKVEKADINIANNLYRITEWIESIESNLFTVSNQAHSVKQTSSSDVTEPSTYSLG